MPIKINSFKIILISVLEFIFFGRVLEIIFSLYEHYIMYRVKQVWGRVHLRKVKMKGRNIQLIGYSRFLNPENLIIGNDVSIGYGCFFFCKGGLEIGDGTILSRNITIYTGNHNFHSDVIPFDQNYIYKKVIIGKGVWVGMGVSILPGVKIGDGAIIGMGTVVSKDVPDGAIVVGSGQRIVNQNFRKDLTQSILSGNYHNSIYR